MGDLYDKSRFGVRFTCEACGGSGESRDAHPTWARPAECPQCQGAGYVVRWVTRAELTSLLADEAEATPGRRRRPSYRQAKLDGF